MKPRITRPGWILALLLLLGGGGYYGVRQGLAWHHWRQAQRLTAEREFDAAQEHIAACLDRWPDSAATHLWAARIARLRQEPMDAFRRLDDALRLGGDAERIILEKYLLRAERGEVDQVEKKLNAFLLKNDPDAPWILDVLSYQAMITQRLADSLKHVNAWRKLQPQEREPLVREAWVLERIRDYPGAIAAYQAALDRDPAQDERQQDRVRIRLAELLLERFRLKEALAQFEVLRDRQPSSPAILFGLARCRLQLGQTEAGMQVLEKLLAEQPRHGKALGELGRALLELEKLPEAETRLRQAAAALPFDRHIVFSLEQCLQKLGKKEEARNWQRRLERIRADEVRMAALMTDAQHSPEDPALRHEIGEIFLRNGMAIDGLSWLNSALLCDENYGPAHEVLAEWWESRSAADKAAPHRLVLERLGIGKKTNRFDSAEE